MSIDELNLSTRTYNTLLRAGITTVEKIKGMTDEELKNVRNLSKKCLNEVKRAVYCTDCERSIYGSYKDCDVNIENNGKYVMAGDVCYCKVVQKEVE